MPPPPQEYWLPGFGLSRHIVLRQLQLFLGPSAKVRPYSYQGREGYMIVGMPLTKQQIEDLKRQSKEYEKQQSIRMSAKQSGSERESLEPDINDIVVVGSGRRSRQGHSTIPPTQYRGHR